MTFGRMLAGCSTVVVIAVFLARSAVSAHDPDFVLGGVGTSTIDGTFAPGEWGSAGAVTFNATVPEGGTTPVTMMVMNDATNLYVAFRVARTSFGGGTNPSLILDNAHNGDRSQGDDGFGMSVGVFAPANFIDFFTDLSTPGIIAAPRDDNAGGTNDGTSAATNDGAFTYIEMAHPLDSTDDAHDFSVHAGDVVGFVGLLRIFHLDPEEGVFADTVFAGDAINPQQNPRGDIVILSASPGSCHAAAAEWRRTFVAACVAAGGSPASCNRTGTEIMLTMVGSCP